MFTQLRKGGKMEQAAKELYEYIANHIWKHGYQPSIRELAAHNGWASNQYVTLLLNEYRKINDVGGKFDGHVGSRALSFDWKQFVTDPTFPRDERKVFAVNTRRGAKAAKRKGR